jgi:hypothetical protein
VAADATTHDAAAAAGRAENSPHQHGDQFELTAVSNSNFPAAVLISPRASDRI